MDTSSSKARRPCNSSTSSERENCVPACHDDALSALAFSALVPKMSRRVRFGGDVRGMLRAAIVSFLAAIRRPRPQCLAQFRVYSMTDQASSYMRPMPI
mmetsp:Transcript_29055/g.46769  ORF Transcript_29055/g.46769 Transcript_29055/m.46769 type:complete len:99 (-) Transcript_29055:48-344(-)